MSMTFKQFRRELSFPFRLWSFRLVYFFQRKDPEFREALRLLRHEMQRIDAFYRALTRAERNEPRLQMDWNRMVEIAHQTGDSPREVRSLFHTYQTLSENDPLNSTAGWPPLAIDCMIFGAVIFLGGLMLTLLWQLFLML